MSAYLSVRDLAVEGRRVFLRLDLNVPMKGGEIQDDTRIRESLPTLRYLVERGARVIACSHMGRPKGQRIPELSLSPVARRLRDLLPGISVAFTPDTLGSEAQNAARRLQPGAVLLLENIRYEAGETRNDPEVAKRIREMADLFVCDAFGNVHRTNASLCAAASLFPQAAAGLLLEKEVDYLMDRLDDPERPYAAFLGGAKVSDKIPVLRRLSERVDVLCIGGAMAYTFLAANGLTSGRSLMEPDLVGDCTEILALAEARGVRVLLPEDHIAAPAIDREGDLRIVSAKAFPEALAAFDIGPGTVRAFTAVAVSSKTIFWNGPMGVFERPAFAEGTLALARAVGASSALSVIGGGDSVSAVTLAGVAHQISHVSTGGGASLELLAGHALPGLEVLTRAWQAAES
jgi:phosphoglycerate kinase